MSWIVSRLHIAGFRGVLDRAGEFELATGRTFHSLAIYAPNASGKSSYADAVEYLFSEDGRIGHLGTDTSALPHVLAAERGIVPQVAITVVDLAAGQSVSVTRQAARDQADALPPALRPLVRAAPAHRVLRQDALERFVADLSPGERYAELARWLGLTHLDQVLQHLDTVYWELQRLDLDRQVQERVQDILRHTGRAVAGRDERAVLDWCAAEAERYLGTRPPIDSLADMQKVIRTLRRFQGRIILSSAVAEAYQAKRMLDQLVADLAAPDGPLQGCATALAEAVATEGKVVRLLDAGRDQVFQEVWDTAAQTLEAQITDHCPVCSTPWDRTRAGTQKGALVLLTRSRHDLARLAAARHEQQQATHALETALRALEARLAPVPSAIHKLSLPEIEARAAGIVQAIRDLTTIGRTPAQVQDPCDRLLHRCRQLLDELRPALADLQIVEVPMTAAQVGAAIDHLQALLDALERLAELDRELAAVREVERCFSAVAETIQMRAGALVDDVVAALQEDVRAIYQAIHPADAAPDVHIVPDPASRSLLVQLGFYAPDRVVPPAGYLSQAQLHTLGLAVFLSALGLFNRAFPFLFLDDIDAAYDAEHKVRLADLLAWRLTGCQVILTTRDWRFYSLLRARLRDQGWRFERIVGWDLAHGPRREVDVDGEGRT